MNSLYIQQDIQNFHKIYSEYYPRIVGYLRRIVGEAEAEDVAQEAFVKVSKALDGFRKDSRLSTWIYRIATNAAMDHLRSRSSLKKAPEESFGEEERESEDKNIWTGETKPSIEKSLIRGQMNDCIRGIVEKLPANYRVVITLSELEGLTNSEIAEILQISLDTAKIRLHRARAKLKAELETQCSFYHDERNELACDRKTTPLKFLKK
jgi:RNA polymerase sigma-70 factor (ECF subfamily)